MCHTSFYVNRQEKPCSSHKAYSFMEYQEIIRMMNNNKAG